MLTELVTVGIVAGLIAAGTYAGFLAGRERARDECHNTIANLRRANAGLRAKRDRLQESNTRMARALGDIRLVDPKAPSWFMGRADGLVGDDDRT